MITPRTPIPVLTSIAEIRDFVRNERSRGRTIGFVPTMGALHRGHARLIEVAAQRGACVIVSIFVNPTQFAPSEDLDRYPRTLEADRMVCAESGAHAIFAPTVPEIYPSTFNTTVTVTHLSQILEGERRPGHFQGVATVVLKLFQIVNPDFAVFGQKDAQQVAVIQSMVRDLNLMLELWIEPTIREADGLALSSRNRYLSLPFRAQAVVISQALILAQRMIADGEIMTAVIQRAMIDHIQTAGDAKIDYVQIVNRDTFVELDRMESSALAVIAVYFGSTRLIDNALLTVPIPPR